MLDAALHLLEEQPFFHNKNLRIYIRMVRTLVNVHHIAVFIVIDFDAGFMLRQQLVYFLQTSVTSAPERI